MTILVRARWFSLFVLLSLVAAGCGLQGDEGGGSGADFKPPSKTEFLVHTGPGGGSDIFVRDLISLMREEDVISSNWPVRNEDAGEGAGAMNYLMGKQGESDTISAITTTWVTTPLTIEGAEDVTLEDLTPIAGLIVEPEVMAVAEDSPYQSLNDFIEDAKQQPGKLIQTGGSTTEVGALNGEILQAEAGTDWKFLSFEEVGQRVAALLNGDAHMMFGSAQDFAAHVDAGKLRIIASISPDPSPVFPDAPTVQDEGFDVELVPQVRGVVGPPGMSEDAVKYYEGIFEEALDTPSWDEYAEKNGLVTQLRVGAEWEDFLAEQQATVEKALETAEL
jgi:putative tricarboxylic transport membrane protein